MRQRDPTTTREAALAVLCALAAGPLAAQLRPAIAESFGTQDSIPYWVLAEDFEPTGTEVLKHSLDPGCLFQATGSPIAYRASVDLPHGAHIASMRVYFFDNRIVDLDVKLESVDWTENPFPESTIVAEVESAGTPNFSSAFVNVSHTVDNFPTGTLGVGERSYRLTLTLPSSKEDTGAFVALCGVRFLWRRTISPAPQVATFNDVPTNHAQFEYIEALAAAGISIGCGNGNYCPDNPLTRGQMAVFLAKALGLHWAAP
jgi:hypothetical protein